MDAAHSYNHLNPLQLEMLKLFSVKMGQDDLLELKEIIVKYLADKTVREADKLWDEKGWTDKTMEEFLNMHERTPYNPNN